MTVCKFWQGGFCRNGSTLNPRRTSSLPLLPQSQCRITTANELDADRAIGSCRSDSLLAPFICFDISMRPPLYDPVADWWGTTLGDCRFEHPPKNQPQSSNRFGALAGSSNMSSGRQEELPYGLSAEVIQRDLTNELPPWILSCYGPGKDAPEQLFGGPDREQSFEEVRLHYLKGMAAGNPNGALTDIQNMYQSAQQQIQNVVANLNQAMQFVVDAGNKHPNRLDIIRASVPEGGPKGVFSKSSSAPTSNPFGAPAGGGGAFGQPSALGQKPSPFGTPAFGQPSTPAATPPFGQPATTSAFGTTTTTSAFGQPATTSAFGQPATTSAFGQPSTLGGASAFGQPSQPSSAFGQTSAAGAKPNPFGTPAFGQPAQPSSGSTFGQPSQPGSGSAFGQPAPLGQKPSPFGAPAGPSPFAASAAQPAANPFGQPAQSTPSPFGRPATTAAPATTNAFGQPPPAASSPFGAPAASTPAGFGTSAAPATSVPASSPFGANTPSVSPFGALPDSAPTPPANPFGQPATAASAPAPAANPFGQPALAASNPFGAPTAAQPAAKSAFSGSGGGAFGGGFGATTPAAPATKPPGAPGQGPYAPDATRQHPDISAYSSKGPDNQLRMFKGRPVTYQTLGKDGKKLVPVIRNPDNSVAKIWFPDGPPAYTPDTEAADPSAYNDPMVQQRWKTFMETGMFEGGLMPEVPPKREFCAWDF
ncbi:hypothetical protein B0T14DRAFT_325806 [Immersiella caudata]|uniref:CCCH zinc finger domain protein n=1 Tax=Immersiella caudata TaxID=314043 RepID=A0AA39U2V7_9PEZI|nr:hypothetical protein B0T14DRAFT_325806 [Immersiella caudata]